MRDPSGKGLVPLLFGLFSVQRGTASEVWFRGDPIISAGWEFGSAKRLAQTSLLSQDQSSWHQGDSSWVCQKGKGTLKGTLQVRLSVSPGD